MKKTNQKTRKTKPREKLLSWFAYVIGGWNASSGCHAGRLSFESDYEDDEKIVRFLLNRFENDIKHEMKQKIRKIIKTEKDFKSFKKVFETLD